ncbi:MAG: SDR family oxidoreductase [Bdellovibrionota bacterium]
METNKTAIVTGGTRGIGKAISIALAKSGYKVLALYARNRDTAEAFEEEAKQQNLSVETIRGDLTKDDSFKEIISAIKSKTDFVDAIVHSAASGVHKASTDLTLKHLRWTFEINVFSIHNLLKELIPQLRPGGRIVGITSNGGTHVIPYYAAVGSSKGALESLFRHYARELAERDISVNLVCPGMVMTDAVDAFPDKENRIQKAIEGTPTGRLTTVQDVGELVHFLCTSPVASQLVGQTIVLDGGKSLLS